MHGKCLVLEAKLGLVSDRELEHEKTDGHAAASWAENDVDPQENKEFVSTNAIFLEDNHIMNYQT